MSTKISNIIWVYLGIILAGLAISGTIVTLIIMALLKYINGG